MMADTGLRSKTRAAQAIDAIAVLAMLSTESSSHISCYRPHPDRHHLWKTALDQAAKSIAKTRLMSALLQRRPRLLSETQQCGLGIIPSANLRSNSRPDTLSARAIGAFLSNRMCI